MIIRKQIGELPLSPGDEVVTAIQFHERILIVTKRGAIYQVLRERCDD